MIVISTKRINFEENLLKASSSPKKKRDLIGKRISLNLYDRLSLKIHFRVRQPVEVILRKPDS